MNKNLLIAGIFGFLVSAAIAEIYAVILPSNVLTSTLTVLVGFIIYKISFLVLFILIPNKNISINLLARLISLF